MKRNFFTKSVKLLVAAFVCFTPNSLWAVTEVNVETAGTLSTLLSNPDKEVKVMGVINGTDIKYLRQRVTAGTVTKLDWSEVCIVGGGDAYRDSYTTTANVIGEKMFEGCSNLQSIILPGNITAIDGEAFARSGLKSIDIPNSVTTIGFDAFAYCNSLTSVVIGKKVKNLNQGVFYGSAVSTVYAKPIVPPDTPAFFSALTRTVSSVYIQTP